MTNNFTDKTVTVPVGCVTPPAKIELSKTATNVSQGNVNATTVTAKAKDRITFTLTAQNSGGTAKDFTFEDTIGDTLEYSRLIDAGGGSFNSSSRILSWPVISLKPGEKQVRVFSVQLLDTIPATPKGISDASSYQRH